MLLPSALPCDSASNLAISRVPRALRSDRCSPFVSPPASPPLLSSQTTIANIMTTCRSLHTFMADHAPSHSPMAQLPTPPLAHAAPPPPLKLRLRSRARPNDQSEERNNAVRSPRKRIVKRAPPRGANKRRRAGDDDMGRDDDEDADSDVDAASDHDVAAADDGEQQLSLSPPPSSPIAPSTPKRARIAPEQLPLGLARSDFHAAAHDLHLGAPFLPHHHPHNHTHPHHNVHNQDHDLDLASERAKPGTDVEVEADGQRWSTEDDRILVELVLEKLKLSRTEWQDCARSLGRGDGNSLGRRWRSLVGSGDVGLRTRAGGRRARIHATWR